MILAVRDTIAGALNTLRANKLRSFLTLLGIIIGISSVITMSGFIGGLKNAINRDLSQLGTGVFQVQKWPTGFNNGRNRAMYERRKNFTIADVHLLQEKCTQCLRVAGEGWGPGQMLTAGDKATRPGVWMAGGTADFFVNNGYSLAEGRLFNEAECAGGAEGIVLGSDVAEILFPDGNAVGQEVRLRNREYRVYGVLERRGSGMEQSIDNIVIMPLATFMTRFGERQSLNITIQAHDPSRMGAAQDQVIALMRRARGVPPEAENDFEMFSNDSMRETFEEMTSTIESGAMFITAISLIIAGIGVMNIMLVAVTERTSEIGVRRALGARRRRILSQFIVESIVLTSMGGLLGLLLGLGFAKLVEVMNDFPTYVPTDMILKALAVAGGVGLIFGIYPAWLASRLDPVEAMRRE